jgi:hypothetical protein
MFLWEEIVLICCKHVAYVFGLDIEQAVINSLFITTVVSMYGRSVRDGNYGIYKINGSIY